MSQQIGAHKTVLEGRVQFPVLVWAVHRSWESNNLALGLQISVFIHIQTSQYTYNQIILKNSIQITVYERQEMVH